jgi:hypothetical protein
MDSTSESKVAVYVKDVSIVKSVQTPSNLPLAEALTWIANNAEEGGDYTITLRNNETISPKALYYNGKNVSVTLDGGTSERTVSLSATGSLFTVESGVTLTLGNNVTLQGRSNNTAPLVNVNIGGTLAMNTGSRIAGNTNSSGRPGGGVFVGNGSAFTMSGGTINGNTASNSNGGGGVFVDSEGAFTMSGGTISGNTASNGGGVVVD